MWWRVSLCGVLCSKCGEKSNFSGSILTSGRLHVHFLCFCHVRGMRGMRVSTLSQNLAPPPPSLIELWFLKCMQIRHALLEKPKEEALIILGGQKSNLGWLLLGTPHSFPAPQFPSGHQPEFRGMNRRGMLSLHPIPIPKASCPWIHRVEESRGLASPQSHFWTPFGDIVMAGFVISCFRTTHPHLRQGPLQSWWRQWVFV